MAYNGNPVRDLIKVGATRAQPLRQQMDFAENIGHLLTYLPEMLPFLLNSTELFCSVLTN